MSVVCKALFQSLGTHESIGSIRFRFHEAKNLVEQVDQTRQRGKMGKGRERRRGKKDKGRMLNMRKMPAMESIPNHYTLNEVTLKRWQDDCLCVVAKGSLFEEVTFKLSFSVKKESNSNVSGENVPKRGSD